MDLEMRQLTRDTFRDFVDLLSVPFSFDTTDEDVENFIQVDELDRMWGAVDGGDMVGVFGAYSFELSVPGGRIPAGGLTGVGVRPTHRRRGVLRQMMRKHFDDVLEREEPASILWASEWPIYGRFGYGVATEGADIEIDTRHARLIDMETSGTLRSIEKDEAAKLFAEVYERVSDRPGMLSRNEAHWKHRHFYDPEKWRDGATAHRYTVYEDAGSVDGYLLWRSKAKWEDGLPGGSARVLELQAATTEAEHALWSFILSLDLTTTVTAGRRPADDGLAQLLQDRRRLKRRVSDALWVAITDVPAALNARRYRLDGELVIGVTDGFVDGVDGAYRLVGGPEGAECVATTDEADLVVSARDLGALYLGGTRLGPLVQWGTAHGSPEAVRKADIMFSWDESPWCPEIF